MIVKGSSRAGPRQLARHLQRTDTNERVEILQLQSLPQNLTEVFRDWQCISESTHGKKGLYHANIDPDARYKMTQAQWMRAADVLEQELGLTGQPRVIVLHEKDGREHIHVVWQRTNTDTMTLVPDSHNYYAHERASLALETEFGHEHVPGKHAKRDRTKPPPKAEINDAEWQQAERTGADPRARKTTIAAIYQQSDNGQALRAALSGAGYILAKGDRRDYVIVDRQGEVHSLSRQIKGVTAKTLREFMAEIDQDSIPNIEQAKALQRGVAARPKSTVAPEAEPSPLQSTEEQNWHPPGLAPEQLARLKSILKERHDEEDHRLHDRQEVERTRTAESIDREIAERLEAFDAMQQAARNRYEGEHNVERGGLHRILAVVMTWINPAKSREEQRQRSQVREEYLHRQQNERDHQVARWNTGKECDLAALAGRHEQQRRENAARYGEELGRFTRDQDSAQRLLSEIEKRHHQQAPVTEQHPAPAVPPKSPPHGPGSSRFLQPQAPAYGSRFIPTTAEGVAIPPPIGATTPVTASRFLQPTPNNPPPDEIAKPPARFSRFVPTTGQGVPIPTPTPSPTPITASRFLTKGPEPSKTEPPQYFGLNSKFLRPRDEPPQPTGGKNSVPSKPAPSTPRPQR